MRRTVLILSLAVSPWLTGTSFAGTLAGVAAPPSELSDELRTEFTEALLRAPTDGARAAGARLARLGPEVVPALFEAVRDGRILLREPDGSTRRMTLGDVHALALIEGLRALPRSSVVGHLRRLHADPTSFADEERVASLVILSEIGSAIELEDLFLLASPGGDRRASRRLRDAVDVALARLFDRDPATLDRLVRVFPTIHPSFAAPVVSVVARRPDERRLAVLTDLLGAAPQVDALLLVEVGRMASRLPRPLDETLRGRVRPYLWSSDEQLLVEAAIASAAMDDHRAVEPLIEVLREPSPNVQSAAVRGLRDLTDRQFGVDPGRWTDWYRHEQAWWQGDAPAQFALIREGTGPEASRVILELSKKRLFRHRLTEFVGLGLERPELDLVVLTCASLGHLGSHTAVPLLVECLERPEPEAKSAAWRALQRITALDLGPDPALWEDAFPSSP